MSSTSPPAWMRLGSLPAVITVLVFLNGLYLALVAFGNITDFGTNQDFVIHVLSMDTTNFGAPAGTDLDPDVMWRAIETTWVQNLLYVLLIAWETATALVLLTASWWWVRGRDDHYARARALSTIGLTMLLLLFFGGFIVVGGEWFQMWKSSAWNGLDPAFRNSVLALLTLILVHLPSSHWTDGTNPSARPTNSDTSQPGSISGNVQMASSPPDHGGTGPVRRSAEKDRPDA